MTKKTVSFDATTKTFYRDLFKRWDLSVETEREVFARSLSIDLVISCTHGEQKKLR